MEFRFRAGDRRPRSPSPPARLSGPCDRRSSPRAGARPFHGEPPLLPPPPPPPPFEWEAAAWRDRIIRGEVERRLVEEAWLIEAEVRRELALVRARFPGGFGPVPFVGPGGPLPPPPPGTFFGPCGPFLPPVPLPLVPVGMHPNWPPPASFGEREGFDRPVGLEQSMVVNRRPLPPPKPKHKLERREIKPSVSCEIRSPETKVSGLKRKADVISASTAPTELQNVTSATTEPAELQNVTFAHTEPAELQNAARHWRCTLCQVSATSRANLNKHYKGRRHLAKLVHSRGLQVIYDHKSGAGPSDAPKKIRILVNGAIHEVVQKSIVLTSATNKPTELQNVIPGATEPDELQKLSSATTEPTGLQNVISGSTEPDELQNVSSATTEPTELQNEIPGTTEPDELQNMSSATTEPTELQNAAKNWSCAVCQVVRATSKANRKKHLKGKKHLKKKLALYGVSVAASGAGPSGAPKKIHILVDGEMHEVVQQGGFVWCERCSIRCTNAAGMAEHLRGKKHSLLNKVWRSIKAVRMKNKSKQDSAAEKQK